MFKNYVSSVRKNFAHRSRGEQNFVLLLRLAILPGEIFWRALEMLDQSMEAAVLVLFGIGAADLADRIRRSKDWSEWRGGVMTIVISLVAWTALVWSVIRLFI